MEHRLNTDKKETRSTAACCLYLCFICVSAVALMALPLHAEGDGFTDEFWLSTRRTQAASAAQLVGAADPWTAAALRVQGFDLDLWYEPPSLLDRVPPLNSQRLGAVRDDTSFAHDENKVPAEFSPQERDEDVLYWQAILYASKVPAAVFAKAAQGNRYLTFGHLYTEPAKYRGKVVHVSGRLGRLKRLDPPADVRGRGITALYEGWLFLDQAGAHPVCVIMPQAPVGVAPGDDLSVRVTVDGYFFKRYRYISSRLNDEGDNIALRTVMLIAPTVTVKTPPPATWSLSSGGSLFGWILGFGALVAVFMVSMTWWFRRNDGLVQARLQAVRANRFAEQAAELEKTLGHANEPGIDGVPQRSGE
jgi:hypothetical protein